MRNGGQRPGHNDAVHVDSNDGGRTEAFRFGFLSGNEHFFKTAGAASNVADLTLHSVLDPGDQVVVDQFVHILLEPIHPWLGGQGRRTHHLRADDDAIRVKRRQNCHHRLGVTGCFHIRARHTDRWTLLSCFFDPVTCLGTTLG